MSSSETVVAIVVGTVVGIAAAHIGSKVIRKVTEDLHQEELEQAVERAKREGWHEASTNEENIRERYKRLVERAPLSVVS